MRAHVLAVAAALAVLAGPALLQAQTDEETAYASSVSGACGVSTNLPKAVCDCLGDLALKEFGEEGRLFLLAVISGETEVANALRPSVPVDEVIAAGLFMVSGTQRCVN